MSNFCGTFCFLNRRRGDLFKFTHSDTMRTDLCDREVLQVCLWIHKIIVLYIPAALSPGVYSASNRNEKQKHKNNNVSGE
jgi:hypothetical protein